MLDTNFGEFRKRIKDLIAEEPFRTDLHFLSGHLANELGISVNSARSIKANITINAQKLITKAGLTDRISNEQTIAIITWYDKSFTSSTPDNAILEISVLLDLPKSLVGKILKAYSDKFSEVIVEEDSECNEKTGSLINYDTPVKRAWRSDFIRFIEESFPITERGKLRVICMPSKNPANEVSLYTEIGILPENIFCIEGDSKIQEEFHSNCLQLGVTPIFGQIETVIGKIPGPVHVANLDMLGGWGIGCAKALSNIELADNAVVIVNRMAARESSEVQKLLKTDFILGSEEFGTKFSELFEALQVEFEVDKQPENWNTLFETLNIRTDHLFDGQDTPSIHTLREELIDSQIVRLAGGESWSRNENIARVREPIVQFYDSVAIFHSVIGGVLAHTFLKNFIYIIQNWREAIDFRGAEILTSMVPDCLMKRPYIIRCEKSAYRSDSGTKGLTYYTTMVQLETPSDLFHSIEATCTQLGSCIVELIKDYKRHESEGVETKYRYYLSERSGEIVDMRKQPRKSECFFVVERIGGDTILRIRMDRLHTAMTSFLNQSQKYVSYKTVQDLERRIISA